MLQFEVSFTSLYISTRLHFQLLTFGAAMVANSKIRTLVNQRTHLRSQLELGGVKAYRGNKRPLTEEELASGKTGNRNLLPREIEERNILVTKVFDPERGAELRDEIQRLEELIQMPDQTRTVALAESTAATYLSLGLQLDTLL